MRNTKKISFVFAVVFGFALAAFVSCKSTPAEVPDDATDLEIIQLAQSAYDAGNQNLAVEYYNILLHRYGMNMASYIEGRYEIAHIYLKQKKYTAAGTMLQEILDIYDSSAPGTLPGAYRKLAQADLMKIPADKLPVLLD